MNEIRGQEPNHENIPDLNIDLRPAENPEPIELTEQPQETSEFEEMSAELSFNGRKTARELLGYLAVHAEDTRVTVADLGRVLDPSNEHPKEAYPSARRSIKWMTDQGLVEYDTPTPTRGSGGNGLVPTERMHELVDGDESLKLKRDFYRFGKEHGLTDPNEIQRQLLDIARERDEE
jgi:hypothetical protein